MRLRTIRGPVAPCGKIEDIEHDAMAAHALLQAIDDWHEKNFTGPDEDVYPSATVAFIEKRAAEILAGWLGEDRG